MKLAMGFLMYSRPLHSALTLAFAFKNKCESTDLHVFYSEYRNHKPTSRSVSKMLNTLCKKDHIALQYLREDQPKNTGSVVDNLMYTLSGDAKYDCFIKLDDDVVMSKHLELKMAEMLIKLNTSSNVYFLAGQAVRDHMIQQARPFCWETHVSGHKIVQRSAGGSPMETFVAVMPNFLEKLKESGQPTGCSCAKGTFTFYSKNIYHSGGKGALVLEPHVVMQHIALCSQIEGGADRLWAPARDFAKNEVIDVPEFDIAKWEASHYDSTQKEFAIECLEAIVDDHPAIEILVEAVKEYDPRSDVALPSGKSQTKKPLRMAPPAVRHKDGTVTSAPIVANRKRRARVIQHAVGVQRR